MQSAIIATDFSAEAEAARRRAASIARETGLHGAIAHVLPDSLPPGMHVQSSAQAQKALAVVADEMKRDGVGFEARLLSGDVARELTAAAAEYDMIVAGARGEDVLLDFAMGRTSTRLVRQCGRPVLIVKRPPDEPYRRVVAAVDFSEPSFAATAAAIQIAPKADFHLVNAFEVVFESSLRRGLVAEDLIQGYRQQAREKAMADMLEFSGKLSLPPERITQAAVHGYPARVILNSAERSNAQLIVVGKHAAGVVERMFIGSVALQVLEMAKCDVLVVPEQVA
jgi:nucleotide-binding universal stress UspA family protein